MPGSPALLSGPTEAACPPWEPEVGFLYPPYRAGTPALQLSRRLFHYR
jgi:hypothetical protein